jgi:hypothetical protein
MNRLIVTATFLALLAPRVSSAAVTVIQVRSAEDPAAPPDPAVCAAAPFAVNLRLGGSLYSYETDERGRVQTKTRRIGHATACAQLTSFLFPAGLAQNFYAQFELPEGTFTASGTCTFITNDVPQAGLVVAGCNLQVIGFPQKFVGGTVTSTSTFNPFRLAGFTTGSYYTFQMYDTAAEPSTAHDSDDAMQWVNDESAKGK